MEQHGLWLSCIAGLSATEFPLEGEDEREIDLNALLGSKGKGKGKGKKGHTATSPTDNQPTERSESANAATTREKRPGDWLCTKCGDLNYAFRTECWKNDCKTPRAANAQLADPVENALALQAIAEYWDESWEDDEAPQDGDAHADAAKRGGKGKGKGKGKGGRGRGKGPKGRGRGKPRANQAQESDANKEAAKTEAAPTGDAEKHPQ